MKRTKTGLAMAALATMLLTASLAMARPGGPAGNGGPGYGPGNGPCGAAYAQLSPEKQAALQKLQEAHYAKTAQLRADLGVKRAELNALSVTGNPDTAKVQALSKDLGDLIGKLTAERTLFRAQVAKEIGPAGLANCGFGGNGGYGHGHMGGGRGMMGY